MWFLREFLNISSSHSCRHHHHLTIYYIMSIQCYIIIGILYHHMPMVTLRYMTMLHNIGLYCITIAIHYIELHYINLTKFILRFVSINGTECDPLADVVIHQSSPDHWAYWRHHRRVRTSKACCFLPRFNKGVLEAKIKTPLPSQSNF